MGKDATNTLFAENQVDQRLGDINGQQFKGEQAKSEFRGEQFNGQFKSEQPFKGEEFGFDKSKELRPFPFSDQFGENADNRHIHMPSGISQDLHKGSGLELRDPVGGFQGDKWQAVTDGGQFKSQPSSTLMADPSAGGFHGDKWKDNLGKDVEPAKMEGLGTRMDAGHIQEPLVSNRMGDQWSADQLKSESRIGQQWDNADQLKGQQNWKDGELSETAILRPHAGAEWSGLPPTHTVFKTDFDSAGILKEEHFSADLNRDFANQNLNKDKDFNKEGFQSVQGDITKNETREAKKDMLAELKSQSGTDHTILPSELSSGTTIHDGRSFKSEDHTMRDATVYDGHSGASALDKLPLADRVVAGVHAGDPLSSATLKSAAEKALKSRKAKKLQKKKKMLWGQMNI